MALNILVGRSYSDSLVTVLEADAIIASLPDSTEEWKGLSTTEKEYRLKLGIQMLGMLPLRGRRAYELQALCFPRTCQADVEIIPDAAKRAQVAIAYQVVHRGLNNRPEIGADDSYGRLTKMSLGGLLNFSLGDKPLTGGNFLDAIIRSVHFSIYVDLKQYISQVRGRSILNADEDFYHTLSSTTSTSTSTTSTSTSTISSTTSISN